jgi:hypothetical protein
VTGPIRLSSPGSELHPARVRHTEHGTPGHVQASGWATPVL